MAEAREMYKNQLQELAQRSCFNLPCYACIREGPDHAPRFKASVNFNGEIFESPTYCTTLRQAEHSAAEVALNVLSTRGPSRSLTARVLDETGVYKNLLQETAHRAGLNLPVYTTVRSGPGHVPVFTSTVELAGMNFTGESAKTKKQAEKNAAIAAWSALKSIPNLDSLSQTSKEKDNLEEQDQSILTRAKDQIKQSRRDQNQVKRRMVRGTHRDNGSSNASLLYQKWRPMDVLMDLVSEGLIQKQNSFVSLLPPPPPRTISKILPTTTTTTTSSSSSREILPSLYPSSTRSRPTPVHLVMAKSQLVSTMQEVPPPLDEHQRDEDEWLNGKSDVNKKQIEKDCLSSVYRSANTIYGPSSSVTDHDHSIQNEQTHIRTTRLLGPPSPSPTCSHVGRSIYSGGYHHPHRIAPAVQIRSVIPVRAAPPSAMTMRHQPSPPPSSVREVANSMSTNSKGVDVLSVTQNSSKPHSTSQLSSEFNKKLQL